MDKIDDKLIAVDDTALSEKIRKFAFTLFIWETAVILTLMLIFYKTIIKYIKKEENIKSFLELMLLTTTHKLGNFLSIYRVNVEILKDRCKTRALERLENAYSIMEKDFSIATKTLKKLSIRKKEPKDINIKNRLIEILSLFGQILKDKKVILSLSDSTVRIDDEDLENILFTVIENVVKYSRSKIHVKMCSDKENVYIFLRNDFKDISKGSGVGLKLVEFIVNQYGGELITRAKKDFLTVILLPKNYHRFSIKR